MITIPTPAILGGFGRLLLLAVTALPAACATNDAAFGISTAPTSEPVFAQSASNDTLPIPGDDWVGYYRLNTGDKVKIEVYGEPDLTIETILDAAGTINFPLLGVVPAKSLTIKELERLITVMLTGDYLRSPRVRAVISQFRPVYVIGAVRGSGSFAYSEGLTVERALALAGGPTPQASIRRIYVLSEGGSVNNRIQVRLDTQLKPGDTVLIEEGVF